MTTRDNGAIETPEWSPTPKPSPFAEVFEAPAIPPNVVLGEE